MKLISGYSFNELFSNAIKEINNAPLCEVGYQNVGGDKTKEIHPAICELKTPTNRHLIFPKRGNNPFATLAETMWVLAGRNDMELLGKFLPKAPEFADDGKVWRAAYGQRLFPVGGEDQLEFCLKQFGKNLATRQAVATIWNPSIENKVEKTKDWPCLVGSTLVHSPEGNIQIKEIKEGYPVYCYDEDEEKIVLKKVVKQAMTGVKKIWKIKLDDDSIIEGTDNHKFMVKTRMKLGHEAKHGSSMVYSYKEVKDLQLGDSLVPIHYFNDENFGRCKHVNLFPKKNWANSNREKEAVMYWEFLNGPVPEGYVVHHKDRNGENNTKENLECITKEEHDKIRTAFERMGEGNPNYNGSKYSESHKKRFVRYTPEQLLNIGQEIIKKENGFITSRIFYKYSKESDFSMTDVNHAFGSFGNFKSALIGNHKIVSVEETEKFEEVYDIEVEDCHNFFIGSGVLVHNCCNWMHFLVRDKSLDLTVAIRSNDIIWGWSAINVYEFTVIQEILARCLGVKVGTFVNLSDSFHMYEKDWAKAQELAEIDVRNVELICEQFPSFDFGPVGPLNGDPISTYKSYMKQIDWLCIGLNSNECTNFASTYTNLSEIWGYCKLYLWLQKEKDTKPASYWESMMQFRGTDLKLSCHYWVMKNVFKYKEDMNMSLLKQCAEDVKSNTFKL